MESGVIFHNEISPSSVPYDNPFESIASSNDALHAERNRPKSLTGLFAEDLWPIPEKP